MKVLRISLEVLVLNMRTVISSSSPWALLEAFFLALTRPSLKAQGPTAEERLPQLPAMSRWPSLIPTWTKV